MVITIGLLLSQRGVHSEFTQTIAHTLQFTDKILGTEEEHARLVFQRHVVLSREPIKHLWLTESALLCPYRGLDWGSTSEFAILARDTSAQTKTMDSGSSILVHGLRRYKSSLAIIFLRQEVPTWYVAKEQHDENLGSWITSGYLMKSAPMMTSHMFSCKKQIKRREISPIPRKVRAICIMDRKGSTA